MLNAPNTTQPPASMGYVGIGIKTSHIPTRQRHVALVYCRSDGETRISHLEWDYVFKDQVWDSTYHWGDAVGLDEANGPAIAAFLAYIDRSRPKIPFGFLAEGCDFAINADTGLLEFRATQPGAGLTCVSYITLVFKSLKLTIADVATWPQFRADDTQWRSKILGLMLQSGVDPERVRRIENALTTTRVRPEELAGAFIQGPWPVAFPAVVTVAQKIVDELEAAIATAAAPNSVANQPSR